MKSVCHSARRNSPSVAERSPAASCIATASRIASSSARVSWSAVMVPAAWSARARSSAGGRSRLPTWSARNGGVVRGAMAPAQNRLSGRPKWTRARSPAVVRCWAAMCPWYMATSR